MPTTDIPLFGVGLHGKSVDVTANKLKNAYYEFQKEPDGTRVAIYGTPGLSLFLDRGDTPWRGLLSFPSNDLLYGVHRGTFWEINNAGVLVSRGTIGSTTGRVDITNDGTRIIVVDGQEIYYYSTAAPATPIAAVADADRPASPNTCCFQGGRILTDENGTGQFKGGGIYAPTAWNGLDLATAESNPDPIVRIVNYRGVLVLFGSHSAEFWQNVGGVGFPYARLLGADLEFGLAARWSVARFMNTHAFLSQNREGQVTIAMLNGYNAERISSQELDYTINNYATVLDATAIGYMLGGHPMYQINFPSAGKSWLYDGSTQYWSELGYGYSGRHRAELAVDFINRVVIADYENGKLYNLDPDITNDNGEPIYMVLRGRHLKSRKKRMRINSIQLGIESGVGNATGQGTDPVAALRLSKDGGHSYGTERYAPMGEVGEYRKRCLWRRLGSARDVVPEITITDPVKRAITDATINIEEGLS